MRFAKMTAALAFATLMGTGQVYAADIYGGGDEGSLKDEPYASPVSTYYLAIRGGVTFPEDTDFEIGGGTVGIDNEYEDAGLFVSGAAGMSMASLTGLSGLRGELEIGYLQNDIDAHVVNGARVGGADAFGETSVLFGLINVFYDFNQFGSIKPFVGGGIGLARAEFDGHGVTGPGVVLDDEDTAFAYQLSAGANIAVAENVDFELGYRYMGVADVELKALDGTGSDVDIDNHIIYGGLRFKM